MLKYLIIAQRIVHNIHNYTFVTLAVYVSCRGLNVRVQVFCGDSYGGVCACVRVHWKTECFWNYC